MAFVADSFCPGGVAAPAGKETRANKMPAMDILHRKSRSNERCDMRVLPWIGVEKVIGNQACALWFTFAGAGLAEQERGDEGHSVWDERHPAYCKRHSCLPLILMLYSKPS